MAENRGRPEYCGDPTCFLPPSAKRKGIQIQPLLQDLFGFHSFSGSGDAVIDIKTTGNDRAQMIQALNGSLLLDITNGAWHGIDMDSILKTASLRKNRQQQPQNPFPSFHPQ